MQQKTLQPDEGWYVGSNGETWHLPSLPSPFSGSGNHKNTDLSANPSLCYLLLGTADRLPDPEFLVNNLISSTLSILELL